MLQCIPHFASILIKLQLNIKHVYILQSIPYFALIMMYNDDKMYNSQQCLAVLETHPCKD